MSLAALKRNKTSIKVCSEWFLKRHIWFLQVTSQPSNGTGTGSATVASNTVSGSQQVSSQPGGTDTTTAINTVGGKDPPKLPRPLVQINCVQARTCLSRLLRYQQGGNNPNYGSAETEPPWWPNELIKVASWILSLTQYFRHLARNF